LGNATRDLDGREQEGCARGLRRLVETWSVKYDKAVECLIKDRDALLAFYDFPAEHWKHLRTTNVIESSFAAVRHRTVRSKPPEGLVWLAYMLKGGSDASNDDPFASEPPTGKKWVQTGPHVMIGGPGIVKMLDSYPASADDTRKPYVMFGGTPYEHLMVPVR
jgi:hypothetical protein